MSNMKNIQDHNLRWFECWQMTTTTNMDGYNVDIYHSTVAAL